MAISPTPCRRLALIAKPFHYNPALPGCDGPRPKEPETRRPARSAQRAHIRAAGQQGRALGDPDIEDVPSGPRAISEGV